MGDEYQQVQELCLKVTSGGTPSRSNTAFWEDGDIPWMKTGEIKSNFVHSTAEHITRHGLESSAAKLIPENSVIVALYGDGNTAGSVAINKIPLTTNQACCNLIIDENKAHYGFLYYYLKGSYNNLVNLKLGGSQQNLNSGTIKSFPIRRVPLPVQRKIAAILTAYDDLIETNKRRITLLEKIAGELYREWFARMRFPGHQNTQFHKGLPADWQINRIREIVDRKKFGRIYRAAGLYGEGSVIVIDQSRSAYLGFYDGKPEHEASPETPILLFGDHSCKMVFMTKPFSLAENVIPFTPKGDMPAYFLFHLVKDLASTTEYKRHWTDLVNRQVLIPGKDLQDSFSSSVRENHAMREELEQTIRILIKTRDLLLPRLISGKLSVENLDIQFPPSMRDEAEEPESADA